MSVTQCLIPGTSNDYDYYRYSYSLMCKPATPFETFFVTELCDLMYYVIDVPLSCFQEWLPLLQPIQQHWVCYYVRSSITKTDDYKSLNPKTNYKFFH